MDIPQQVTRFYGSLDYALDVIKNRRIAFVHISKLNDPFDPYCFFETDFEDNYLNLLRHVRENHPRDLNWFRTHVTPLSWRQTVKDLKTYLQKVRNTGFVLSTSAARSVLHPKDNLYMWGHYANGHRGLAIEFDTQALASAVQKHHEAENGKPSEDNNVWAEIEYTKAFTPITAEYVFEFMKQEETLLKCRSSVRTVTRLDEHFKRMTIIKSDVWQMENEWRLMWHNDESEREVYKCPIDEGAICSIFLGLNIETEESEKLIAASKENFPAASIFRARKRHGSLALEFDQVWSPNTSSYC